MFFTASSNEAALWHRYYTVRTPASVDKSLSAQTISSLGAPRFNSRHFPCESLIAVGNRRRYRIRRTALVSPQHSLVREDPDALAVRHIDQAPCIICQNTRDSSEGLNCPRMRRIAYIEHANRLRDTAASASSFCASTCTRSTHGGGVV
jgi:hypothetical protein